MESLGIIDIPRDRRSHPFSLRNARADQVPTLRQSDYAIDALLISHLHSRVVEGVRLRFPVVTDLGQFDPLFAQRAPAGIGDPARDYASSLKYEIEPFDFLALQNAYHFALKVGWESSGDQVFVGNDTDMIAPCNNPSDAIPALLIRDCLMR